MKVLIAYFSLSGKTEKMAEAIGQGLAANGVLYKAFHVAVSDRPEDLTRCQELGHKMAQATVSS